MIKPHALTNGDTVAAVSLSWGGARLSRALCPGQAPTRRDIRAHPIAKTLEILEAAVV
jgi:hypothetical protein